MTQNIFNEFKGQCEATLLESINKLNLKERPHTVLLKETVSPIFGELTSPICFDLARSLKKAPTDIAQEIISSLDYSKQNLIGSVEEAGGGYINFRLNYVDVTKKVFRDIASLQSEFGYVKSDKPQRVVVEHTSVNPIHPIHIGQARNSILGDALARLLTNRGHIVRRRYYIDDMGRQSAILAYGYQHLKDLPIREKSDHLLGKIYSITACLIEMQALNQRIDKLSSTESDPEEHYKLQRDRDEWASIAEELKEKYSDLFSLLQKKIEVDQTADVKVADLNKRYEQNDPEALEIIHGVSELCLEGFQKTLSRLDIRFDKWDWESELVWSGQVNSILDRLAKSGYAYNEEEALKIDSPGIVDRLNLRGKLGISDNHDLSSLTLARSDGTTLYTTRDIAYTIAKFKEADKVINVIGAEQKLAQLQLKIALYSLGEDRYADNLTHFAFGLVDLPGYKMSSRRGRIITLDEVVDEAISRSSQEVEKRAEPLTPEEQKDVAEKIGIASIKYALLSVEPNKTVTFTWDRVLNLESNSAPFINYAFTRACGILRKISEEETAAKPELLIHDLEKELLLKIIKFPDVFQQAADQLKPENLIGYANNLTEKFHEYYERVSIIRTADPVLRSSRRLLINAIKITLENALNTLGIQLTEKM
ncbi:arginine--tRNA ligase [[Eubacterium] cellulosolvens]